MSRSERPEPGTLAVWAGEETSLMQGATQVPVGLGQKPGHIYGRNTNPTVQVFEEKVRQLGIEETDDLITDLRQALDQE